MKRVMTLAAVLTAALTLGLPAADAGKTLSGTFVWGNKGGETRPLKATLTPDGAGVFKVSWEAEWKGKPTYYTGEIKGDVQSGAFTGTATDKSGKRTWRVEGKSEAGILTFDHFETTKGREGKTGTGTLQ